MDNKQKVIVICPPRSGSNLLCRSLGKHSQIWNFGERIKHADKQRDRTAKQYLEDLYSKSTKPIICVKTLFSHYYRMKEELERIIKEEEYSVILLRRKSLLKQYISLMVAFATNNFAGGKSNVGKPLTLDIDKGKLCLSDWVKETVVREQEMEERYPEALLLWYESFKNRWDAQTRKVQQYIGVPYEQLYKTSSKQIVQPYRSIVTNYETIKRWLIRNGFRDRI